jgi:rod shape-determining protein MreC
VRVVEGGVHAILVGDNSPAPVMETLSNADSAHPGDQVVTSGDGGLLPPGLPVGVLIKDAGGFRVALYADPAASQDVRIVDYQQPPEALPKATLNDLPAGKSPPEAAAKPVAKTPEAASDGAH